MSEGEIDGPGGLAFWSRITASETLSGTALTHLQRAEESPAIVYYAEELETARAAIGKLAWFVDDEIEVLG